MRDAEDCTCYHSRQPNQNNFFNPFDNTPPEGLPDLGYYRILHGCLSVARPDLGVPIPLTAKALIPRIKTVFEAFCCEQSFREFRSFTGMYENAYIWMHTTGAVAVAAGHCFDRTNAQSFVDSLPEGMRAQELARQAFLDFNDMEKWHRINQRPVDVWKSAFDGREKVETESARGHRNPLQTILYGTPTAETFQQALDCIQELRSDIAGSTPPATSTPAAEDETPRNNYRYRRTKKEFAALVGVSPQAIQKQIDARNPKYVSNLLEISGHWYTSPNAVNILKSAIQQNKRNNQT